MHAQPRLRVVAVVLALAVAAVATAASSSGGAARQDRQASVQGEERGQRDFDKRQGRKAPTAHQQQLAAASDVHVRWSRFGTPQSLTADDGSLASGLAADAVRAAREYLTANRELLGVSQATVDSLELLYDAPLGAGSAVLFRQRFGHLPAVHDGLVALAVSDGAVHYVSSSLAENALTGSTVLDAAAAVRAAAGSLGVEVGSLSNQRTENGWTVFDAGGLTDPARAQLGALPTPADGARTVYTVSLFDNAEGDVRGSTSYVDAATGEVLVSEDTVDYASDNPSWKVFAASPPLDYSSTDTRQLWCWTFTASVPGCQKAVSVPASPVPWDVDAVTGTPTLQSRGNNERSTEK
jgi:extracellular elastinolytic metalloproteinase